MICKRYACPDCAYQFTYEHHPSIEADPAPRYCPKCGFDSEEGDYDPAVVMPHIGHPVRQNVDGLHRAMEEGEQFRADMAQEQFGMDAEGARAMKMTDMKDHIHEGDTSYVPVNNEVSRLIEQAPPGNVGFVGAQGLGYSGSVGEGMYPNAGAKAQRELRRAHAAYTASAGHAGATSSSLPALETTAPTYRRRV